MIIEGGNYCSKLYGIYFSYFTYYCNLISFPVRSYANISHLLISGTKPVSFVFIKDLFFSKIGLI